MTTSDPQEQNVAPGIHYPGPAAPGLMPATATIGRAITFGSWALLSQLGATLREQLHLTAFQQSLVVAVPEIVGPLGHR